MTSEVSHARPRTSYIARILAGIAAFSILAFGAYFVLPSRYTATVLFEIDRPTQDQLIGSSNGLTDDGSFELAKKKHLALVTSKSVLSAALRDPKLDSLSILNDHSDPAAWLREHLEVSFSENGEILAINVQGSKSQQDELVSIVEAVGKAYLNEAISERQMRYLVTRDALARNLQILNIDIKRRLDEYLDIERESPPPKSYYSEFQQFDTNQLVREINQLQNELAVATSEHVEASDSEYVRKLRDRQDKMMNELKMRIEGGQSMFPRRRDLEQLQQIAHDIAVDLEQLDAEAASPDQIRKVQNVIITKE